MYITRNVVEWITDIKAVLCLPDHSINISVKLIMAVNNHDINIDQNNRDNNFGSSVHAFVPACMCVWPYVCMCIG